MQRSPAVSRCAPFGVIHIQEHVVLCRWGTCRKCVLGGLAGAATGSSGGWRGSNGMAGNGCALQKANYAAHTLLVSAPVSALNLSRAPHSVRTSREESGVKHKDTAWSLGSLLLATAVMSRHSTWIGQRYSRWEGLTAAKTRTSLVHILSPPEGLQHPTRTQCCQ